MTASHPNLFNEIIDREFPRDGDELYLNTGSSGIKPTCVIQSISQEFKRFNRNPTIATFLDDVPFQTAREAVSKLISVPEKNIFLTQNTTQGLQLIMQSLLCGPGDELISTDCEHGSLKVIARYLEETRGIKIRIHQVAPHEGSEALSSGIFKLTNDRTKLIALSEIFSYTGWRPNLATLASEAAVRKIPLLIDGAHSAGQVICNPTLFPLWVGSAHKWLGGPSGTGFTYIAPHMMPLMKPVVLGDTYYERHESNPQSPVKFESQGTSDVIRWSALATACDLQFAIGPQNIINRSWNLVTYLREKLAPLAPIYRTPELETNTLEENFDGRTAMLAFRFANPGVSDLRDTLWRQHQIFVQPDFIGQIPGHGMRISCHYSLRESDLDRLVDTLEIIMQRG